MKINMVSAIKVVGYGLYIVGGVVIALADVPELTKALKTLKIEGPK